MGDHRKCGQREGDSQSQGGLSGRVIYHIIRCVTLKLHSEFPGAMMKIITH